MTTAVAEPATEALTVRRLKEEFPDAVEYAHGFRGDAGVHRRLAENARAALEPPVFSWCRFAAALTGHIPWLALRAVGWR